jgi:hypothetical protein
LAIINYINANPGGSSPPASQESPPRYYDVAGGSGDEGDGLITAGDVLAVINYINTHPAVVGEAEAIEASPPALPTPPTPADSLPRVARPARWPCPENIDNQFPLPAPSRAAASLSPAERENERSGLLPDDTRAKTCELEGTLAEIAGDIWATWRQA